jgi:hypothetical protein
MRILLDGGDPTTMRAGAAQGQSVERRLRERWSAEADARG